MMRSISPVAEGRDGVSHDPACNQDGQAATAGAKEKFFCMCEKMGACVKSTRATIPCAACSR
jgi:hypothetical protein